MDNSKSKKNPWIVIERQYRHAANQYLVGAAGGQARARAKMRWPAPSANWPKRPATGAKKWKPLVEYYASPGFLGESMKVFLAEGLVAGDAHPEEDEKIEFRLVKLSDVLKMIDKGAILDGKTLTSVLLYARHDRRSKREEVEFRGILLIPTEISPPGRLAQGMPARLTLLNT